MAGFRRLLAHGAVPLAALLVLAACSSDGGPAAEPTRGPAAGSTSAASSPSQAATSTESDAQPVRARFDGVVARNLQVPWGLAFLPDGSALVSERDSERIRRVSPTGEVRTVGRVEGVDGVGEGGLLGLAVSPSYADDQAIFVYFTAGSQNIVARLTYDGERLGSQRRILDGIPAGSIHNGGRIAFGPDGMLYVGTGDAGRSEQSQDPDALGGKILRITPDGEPAPGNPEPGSPVYSLGHRNVQGLAWDDRGRMWAAEFGQNEWDELNLVEPGSNYGWPVVEGRSGDDRFVDPMRQWRPAEASPSGIAVAGGSVFLAGLRGNRLWQVPLRADRTREPDALLRDRFGRLRTVVAAPDGSLWVTTSNRDGRGSPASTDDRILRVRLS